MAVHSFGGFGCTHERINAARARCEAVGVGGLILSIFSPSACCSGSSLASSAPAATSSAIRRTRSTESSSLGSEAAPSSSNVTEYFSTRSSMAAEPGDAAPAIGVARGGGGVAAVPARAGKVWRCDLRAARSPALVNE